MSAQNNSNKNSYFLLLNKERGFSSAATLNKLKRLINAKKAGYCGTLDPMAAGLLVIAVNDATKYIKYATDSDKCYEGIFELGKTSTTMDAEGEITVTASNFDISKIDWHAIEKKFFGTTSQVPPAFSAIKVDGKRSYELARKGEAVELTARNIEISKISLIPSGEKEVRFIVECSKGTYIRSLVSDIGALTGLGAMLTSLTRTRVGNFTIDNSVSIADIINDKEIVEKKKIAIDLIVKEAQVAGKP